MSNHHTDPDKVVREMQKQERLIELETNLQRMADEKLQRDNRKAAQDLGLIDSEQYHRIAQEQCKENDLLQTQRQITAKQKLRGLVRDRDGNYKDFNGNKFDSVGNKIEDEGEWQ